MSEYRVHTYVEKNPHDPNGNEYVVRIMLNAAGVGSWGKKDAESVAMSASRLLNLGCKPDTFESMVVRKL